MKSNQTLFRGIYAPVPTAFTPSGNLFLQGFQDNIRNLNAYELSGYVVLGSNGEFVLLDRDEKIRLMRAAREAIPREKQLVAGTGCQSARETIRLCKEAHGAGADSVLVITPCYYRGLMDGRALSEYYCTVADASPLPVILYNMPACTGIDLSAPTLETLSRHSNITGLKDSGGNLTKAGRVLQNAPPGFSFLAGSGGFLLPALAIGASGGILALANIAPHACLKIWRLFQQGKLESARNLQIRMVALNQAVTRIGGVPALKAAMDILGMYGGPVRSPLIPADRDQRMNLERLFEEIGVERSH